MIDGWIVVVVVDCGRERNEAGGREGGASGRGDEREIDRMSAEDGDDSDDDDGEDSECR